jgi:hypothetical protein
VAEGPQAAIEQRTDDYVDLFSGRQGSGFQLAIESTIPDEIHADHYDRVRYEVQVGEQMGSSLIVSFPGPSDAPQGAGQSQHGPQNAGAKRHRQRKSVMTPFHPPRAPSCGFVDIRLSASLADAGFRHTTGWGGPPAGDGSVTPPHAAEPGETVGRASRPHNELQVYFETEFAPYDWRRSARGTVPFRHCRSVRRLPRWRLPGGGVALLRIDGGRRCTVGHVWHPAARSVNARRLRAHRG